MPKRRAEIEDDPHSQSPYSPINRERTKRLKAAPYRPAYSSLLVTEDDSRPVGSSSLSTPTEDQDSHPTVEALPPYIRPHSPLTSPYSSSTATYQSHTSDFGPEDRSSVVEIVELGIDLSALDLAGCDGETERSMPRRDRRPRWSSSSSSRPPIYQYRQRSQSVFIDDDLESPGTDDRDTEVGDDQDLFIEGALRMDWTTPSRSSSSRNRRFASISLESPDPHLYEHRETNCNPPASSHGSTHWHSDPLAPSDLLIGSRFISRSRVSAPPKCPKALRTSLDDPPPDPFPTGLPYSLSSRKNKATEPPSASQHMRNPIKPVAELETHARNDQADLVQATPMRLKSETLRDQFMRFKRPHDHWSPTPSPSPPSYTASMRGDYEMQ